jgi:hypothetical protein
LLDGRACHVRTGPRNFLDRASGKSNSAPSRVNKKKEAGSGLHGNQLDPRFRLIGPQTKNAPSDSSAKAG